MTTARPMTTGRKVQFSISLILLTLVVLVGSMFTIQNSARLTDLSLDLYFVATHLQRPLPVPWLMWAAFGVGALLGLIVGLLRRGGNRRYEDEPVRLSRAGASRSDDDWT